jgi:energy-coupling factor transport system ATP-binding protein
VSAIIFDNFSYAYSGGRKVLDGVSLKVAQGSFTVIAGPSGAGKTTLCLAVCGVVPHYFGGSMAGRVLVDGSETATAGMSELAARVGTVLEDYESQLVTMTVAEEIAFALENRGEDNAKIGRRIAEVLAQVGLTGLDEREVSSLSGGQKQRLAIASVLATRPDILVLDEPASALDPEGAEELYALLAALNQSYGITIVVVEHELARVLAHAHQLVLLAGGRVAAQGTPAEVLANMAGQEAFAAMLPSLWQVKTGLEEDLGLSLGHWRREEDAAAELAEFIISRRRGGVKSA